MNRFYNPYYMPTYYYPSYNIPVRTPYYVYLEGGLIPYEGVYPLLSMQYAYDPYALDTTYNLQMIPITGEQPQPYNDQTLLLLLQNRITDDELKDYYKRKYINKEEYNQLKKLDEASRYDALELMLLEKQDNSTKLRKKKTSKKSPKKYSFQDGGIMDKDAYERIDFSYD